MEISFIHTQISVHLRVNKTNFHRKGFALGLALKLRRKATRNSPRVILAGHWRVKLGIQMAGCNKSFQNLVFALAQLHFDILSVKFNCPAARQNLSLSYCQDSCYCAWLCNWFMRRRNITKNPTVINPLSPRYLDFNSPNLPSTKCMNSVGRIGS